VKIVKLTELTVSFIGTSSLLIFHGGCRIEPEVLRVGTHEVLSCFICATSCNADRVMLDAIINGQSTVFAMHPNSRQNFVRHEVFARSTLVVSDSPESACYRFCDRCSAVFSTGCVISTVMATLIFEPDQRPRCFGSRPKVKTG